MKALMLLSDKVIINHIKAIIQIRKRQNRATDMYHSLGATSGIPSLSVTYMLGCHLILFSEQSGPGNRAGRYHSHAPFNSPSPLSSLEASHT